LEFTLSVSSLEIFLAAGFSRTILRVEEEDPGTTIDLGMAGIKATAGEAISEAIATTTNFMIKVSIEGITEVLDGWTGRFLFDKIVRRGNEVYRNVWRRRSHFLLLLVLLGRYLGRYPLIALLLYREKKVYGVLSFCLAPRLWRRREDPANQNTSSGVV
jgi:hypothetical protein